MRIFFIHQKNDDRFDRRSQRRSGDATLCPVRRFSRAVVRVRAFVPNCDGDTPLCSVHIKGVRSKKILQTYLLQFLKSNCTLFGGKERFGFGADEIGNKSIRSGCAMALFLKNHSSDKIMLLGRWKSKAFLDYIRPQIIEWVNNFSTDIISFNNFFELFSPSDFKVQKQTVSLTKDFEFPEMTREQEMKNGERWNPASSLNSRRKEF